MHLGSASLVINIARMLWSFDIGVQTGLDGKKLDVDM